MTTGRPRGPHSVHLALFGLALRLYPRSFRERFGARMERDFRELLRAADTAPQRHLAALRESLDLVLARLRHRRDQLLPVSAFPETEPMKPSERMADLWSDFRLALRNLRHRPGYSVIVIVTLALGAGASAAVYTVVDTVLWAPLPYEEPDELIALFRADPERGNANRFPLDATTYREWSARATTLAGTAAYQVSNMVVFEADDWPQRIQTATVEPGLFPLLGARPALGAPLPPAGEDGATALLSHAFWQRAFGGDLDIVGQTIRLDGRDHLVVGVMPADFRFPHYSSADVWRPLHVEPSGPGQSRLLVLGRLAPGVSQAAAFEELDRIAPQVAAENGIEDRTHANIIRLRDMDTMFIRPVLLLLALAVGLLLVIAAVNLTGLTLARGIGRRREMAVRAALGASRLQLGRLVFLELLVLGLLGGALAGLLGSAAVGGLMQVAPTWPPSLRTATFGLDGVVAALLLAVGVSAAFGLVPALRLSSPRVGGTLRAGGRGGSEGRGSQRWRRVLVAAQMALAAVLLVGAALMVRSVLNILALDLGMTPDGLVTARIGRSGAAEGAAPDASGFAVTLLETATRLPWIQDVAATSSAPMGPGADWKRLRIDGVDPSQRMALGAEYRQVSPGYLELLGLRRLQGRLLTAADNVAGAPPVAVVSQDFVTRFLGAGEALGRIVETRDSAGPGEETRAWQIVGVVDDVREYGAAGFVVPLMYVPLAQDPPAAFSLLLRTEAPLDEIQQPLRELAGAIDASRPVERIGLLTDDLESGNRLHSFVLLLLAGFATIAMVLAAVGLYGTMSQQVGARTREIAVRCALGADAGLIRRMVLRSGGVLVISGLGLGLLASLPVARQMAGMVSSTLLVDVAWWDPVSYLAVPAVLTAVTFVASVLPARRAAAVDPASALRADS